MTYRWRQREGCDFGLMNWFSDSIRLAELSDPRCLPDLRRDRNLIIGSDYSGQHKGAAYEAIALLLSDSQASAAWNSLRRAVRRAVLGDGRRMSYKALNDRRRRAALRPFLDCANTLEGLLIAILVSRAGDSLFGNSRRLDFTTEELRPFSHWDGRIFERMLLIIHVISVLLGGLSAPGQNLLWITDEDDIAPNRDRLGQLTRIFATISSHYLPHDLGTVRIGTTNIDDSQLSLEDFVAIPDLVAGALAEVVARYRALEHFPVGDWTLTPPPNLPDKARLVMDWFADLAQPLRRFVFVIDRGGGTSRPEIRMTRMTFLGGRV